MSLAQDNEADGSGAEPPESLQGGNSDKAQQNPKGLLRADPSHKRTISPLMLFKEDFGHFKEDLNNFKVDFLSMFKDRDTGTTQEDIRTTASPLTLLKDDLNQFKEDFSSVFTIGLSTDRGVAARDRSPHAVQTLVPKAEGGQCPGAEDQSHLFVRADDLQGTAAETPSESQGTQDGKGRVDEDSHNNEKGGQNPPQDGEKDPPASEETWEDPHTDQEVLQPSDADLLQMATESWEDSGDEWSDTLAPLSEEEEEEEEEDFQLLPPEPLTTDIRLLSLRPSTNTPSMRDQLGDDRWWVKNYACYLTFDPNTANCELRLSDSNRTATRVWPQACPAHHPERFQQCPQVLCREGLLDSAYWEVEWSGSGADVGVAYNSIGRAGEAAACLLGHNARSWSLECSQGGYAASHDGRRWGPRWPAAPCGRRVGVYLNWEAGTLSFYGVTRDAMVHLHTFSASFSEPLYPAFWLWAAQGSVSLRQVEMGWERLLR